MFSFVQKERQKVMFLQEHDHRKSTWFGGQQSIDQKINRSYSLIKKNGQNFLLFAENVYKIAKK